MNSKTKILFILHLPPPVHGAAIVGEYIRLSKKINSDFNCSFINLSTSGSLKEIGKKSAVKFVTFLQLVVRILHKLLSEKYNNCYITINSKGAGFYKDLFIILIVKLFGKKVVYHFHNKGVSQRQTNWLDNILYKITFHDAFIILLSPRLYNDIKKYVTAERIYYCPNGIPLPPFKEKIFLNSEKPVILFLSNFIRSKGVLKLLYNLAILREWKVEFRSVFAGQWGDVSATEFENEKIRLGLDECVKVILLSSENEKEKVFMSSHIFVLPTMNDCFPLVILEAMSYGLPVISSYEGGIPDMVINNETGYLCDPADPYAIAEKLKMLIEDPVLRSKMGIAGRRRTEENFSISKFEQCFTETMARIACQT